MKVTNLTCEFFGFDIKGDHSLHQYNNRCRKSKFCAHAIVHALRKGQEGRIGVVLAKLNLSLVGKSVHVV